MANLIIENLDDLLGVISPNAPCGENLEYSPQFLELEKEIEGKPESQYGDVITPAVPPDWKIVKKLSIELMGRTRDLRLIGPMFRASIALHGIAGLSEVLLLTSRLIDEHWDFVHPQLDPLDDLDPMSRINSLSMLAEFNTSIKELREMTIVVLPGLGPLTLRDLEFSLGEIPTPEGVEKINSASILSSLKDVDPTIFKGVLDALNLAYDSVLAIESSLLQKVGVVQTLNIDLLRTNLKRARDFFNKCNDETNEVVSIVDSKIPDFVAVSQGVSNIQKNSGEITTRNDVSSMIDKICAYYQKNEPSSPVPLVLQRAKRLVNKNFIEIMEDLASDGLNQVNMITGANSNNEQ